MIVPMSETPEILSPAAVAEETPELDVIIDTRHPAANLASRSNIVADGPGTVADFLDQA